MRSVESQFISLSTIYHYLCRYKQPEQYLSLVTCSRCHFLWRITANPTWPQPVCLCWLLSDGGFPVPLRLPISALFHVPNSLFAVQPDWDCWYTRPQWSSKGQDLVLVCVCVCLFNLIYGAWASRQGRILLVSIAYGHLNLIPRYLATWVLSSSDTDIALSGVGVMPWNTAPMEMMHIVRQWFGT